MKHKHNWINLNKEMVNLEETTSKEMKNIFEKTNLKKKKTRKKYI